MTEKPTMSGKRAALVLANFVLWIVILVVCVGFIFSQAFHISDCTTTTTTTGSVYDSQTRETTSCK